jgi:putative transposase
LTFTSASDKNKLIETTHPSLSIGRQCELLGINRSSFYYEPIPESAENLSIMAALDKLHTDYPFYGVRRMRVNLDPKFQPVNDKRVRRLMRLMNIQTNYPRPNLSKKNEGHEIYPYLLRGLTVERPMQVWSTDITYVPMAQGFMYLCAVIDWHSRFITSWRLSNSLTIGFCKEALEESLDLFGCPEIFNTDQGSQFTSPKFTQSLTDRNIAVSMDGKGRALDNIFIERFWRTIKYENIYLHAYENGLDLHKGLSQYFDFYCYQRKHQSLNWQTPSVVFNKK